MSRWRRLRAAFGVGLTWSAAWAALGTAFGLVTPILFGVPIPLLRSAVSGSLLFGTTGFVLGSLFSGVLRLAEGRRRFDELSLPRFAAWGTLAGAIVGGLATGGDLWRAGDPFVVDATLAAVTALLGGASATGSLWVARRAEDRVLLAEADDVRLVGLSEEERERLLGDPS
jgi:hypothetical protein